MIPNYIEDDGLLHSQSLDYSNIRFDRLNSMTTEANSTAQFLRELKDRIGSQKAKIFSETFAEALDLIDEANEYSKFRYSKLPDPRNDVFFSIEVIENVMDYMNDEPALAVKMCNHQLNKDIYLWDYNKFKERVEMMLDWYNDMTGNQTTEKEKYFDPWTDLTDEEVLFYMEDEQEEQENQKARLMLYIQTCQNNKKIIDKKNKEIMKNLK